MRTIDTIIVHCSATPQYRDVSAADIRLWHTRDNGWRDIGYHYVIRRSGDLEVGRPLSQPGAHTRGHNTNSIGICLIGGTDANDRKAAEFNYTYRQMATLLTLICDLKGDFKTIKKVAGHRDFDPGKACPCFDVGAWFNE